MAYTILNTDGTTLTLVADGTIDQSTTSLTLIGKNKNSYGEELNNNFVKLLANSANTAGRPPRSPLKGQLWYDTTNRRLKVYDDGFQPISGALISSAAPSNAVSGDIWFDTSNDQMNVRTPTGWKLVGPAYSKSVGLMSWTLPPTTIKDEANVGQQVAFLKNYGETVGLISNTYFKMSPTDFANNMPVGSTSTVVSGLTIIGDIDYTGRIKQKYLSINVDVDRLNGGAYVDVENPGDIPFQESAIISLLNKVYPPTGGSHIYDETGVTTGTEARAIITFSNPSPGGYQVRRYRVNNFNTWAIFTTTSTGVVLNLVY